MGIRIIIADDHQIVRQCLKGLLEKEPLMEVVGQAESGVSALNLARELAPHVIIMDINMPEMNGIEATRRILAESPHLKIIALSMYADLRAVIEFLQAGGRGYLLKDCAYEELVQAIRQVMANQTYLCQGVARLLEQTQVNGTRKPSQSVLPVLTRREGEVLQLLVEGLGTSQIADHLQISIKTVETLRQQISQKLGTRSVAELTRYALREGLTSLEA